MKYVKSGAMAAAFERFSKWPVYVIAIFAVTACQKASTDLRSAEEAAPPQAELKLEPPAPLGLFPPGFENEFFRDAKPISEETIKNNFGKGAIDPDAPLPSSFRRIRDLVFVAGSPGENPATAFPGLCEDFAKSLELYDGFWNAGCSVYPIHPDHPHKERFANLEWKEAALEEGFDAIRSQYRAVCDQEIRYPPPTRSPRQKKDECWDEVALAFRLLAIEKRLLLQRSHVDFDQDDAVDPIYRYAIRDRSACFVHDGALDYTWTYAMRGDTGGAAEFNTKREIGSAFAYNGPSQRGVFFWHPGGYITQGVARYASGSLSTYGSVQACHWKWDIAKNPNY